MRRRAIYCCLKYGLLPWWFYESRCHYFPMTYMAHLRQNLVYAFVWLTFRESAEDCEFEARVNSV